MGRRAVMWMPCLVRSRGEADRPVVRLGHALVDDYLEFVAARARPNTVLAYAFDLKVFFEVVGKDPTEVVAADVLGFITRQRSSGSAPNVVRLADGESGLSARTICSSSRRARTSMAAAWARDRSRQRTRPMATDDSFLGRGWAFPP